MADPHTTLYEAVRVYSDAGGLNLIGTVVGEEFDQCQPCHARVAQILPGCGTVLVLAAGGSDFWRKMVAANGEPGPPRPGYHPVHERSKQLAQGLIDLLAEHGSEARAVFPDDVDPLNFLQLAECAGLGTVSPVSGWLLHPEFGSWVSLRAAILIRGTPLGTVRRGGGVSPSYQPCVGCPRPCVDACPVQAYSHEGRFDALRCAKHRHAGGSADGCEVRRACPVGAHHRYGPREEAFRHTYSRFVMQRWFGLGWWKVVPRSLRPRV